MSFPVLLPDAGLLPRLGNCKVPVIGIGTYELRGVDCIHAVRSGLQCGFRLVDTAASYHNEDLVGEGIRSSGVDRSELFVVVKILLKSMVDAGKVRQSILDSIRKLQIVYADCVILHWPGCGGLKPGDAAGHAAARRRCWKVMEELQKEGFIQYMGVSNFLPHHFTEIDAEVELTAAACVPVADDHINHNTTHVERDFYETRPVLNQIELHPLCLQEETVAYCRGRGMVLQQYSPLGQGDVRLLQHPKLLELQQNYFPQHTVPDILLMWGLAQGFCTLVRSHSKKHHRTNLQAAIDYFASLQQQQKGHGDGVSQEMDVTHKGRPAWSPTPRWLSSTQMELLRGLREFMGIKKDTHFCWYSSEIA